MTRSFTAATGDRLSLVASSTREASDLDVSGDWRLHCHGHHSGARLYVEKALHREVLDYDYLPIEAKIEFEGLVGCLERDLVHKHLVEDLVGRPRGKVDTPKI